MKILHRRKLFERVRREVRIGGSGKAGSRAEILGFGGRPAPVCVHIKELIISGPFRDPEGSKAIRVVFGTVQGTEDMDTQKLKC